MKALFRYLFGTTRLQAKVHFLDAKIKGLLKDKAKSDKELEAHRQRYAALQAELQKTIQSTRQALDDAETLTTRLERALVGAQEELKIANEQIIPYLIAANKTFESAFDYQTSRLAVQQALMNQKDAD